MNINPTPIPNKSDASLTKRRLKLIRSRMLAAGNIYSRRPVIRLEMRLEGGHSEELPPEWLQKLAAGLPIFRAETLDFAGWHLVRETTTPIPVAVAVELLAILLQRSLGWPVSLMDSLVASRRSTLQQAGDRRVLVFEARQEASGVLAGRMALELCTKLDQALDGEADLLLAEAFRTFRRKTASGTPHRAAIAIVTQAEQRGIPWGMLPGNRFVRLGRGRSGEMLRGYDTSLTSCIASNLAKRKDVTLSLLAASGLPVPLQKTARRVEAAIASAHAIGFPVVMKPLDGSEGRAVFVNLWTDEEVEKAFSQVKTISSVAAVVSLIQGETYRLSVIGGRLFAAALRHPPRVQGDGVHTIEELITEENRNPERQPRAPVTMEPVVVDADMLDLLKEQGMTPASVPEANRWVLLRQVPNPPYGHTTDVTDLVHPTIRMLAERVAAVMGISVCGIDFVTTDISRPYQETGGAICEVNTLPDLSLHQWVSEGTPRNGAKAVLDMLFPPGKRTGFPIIVILRDDAEGDIEDVLRALWEAHGYQVGVVSALDEVQGKDSATFLDCLRALDLDTAIGVGIAVLSPRQLVDWGLGYDSVDLAVVPSGEGSSLTRRARRVLERVARVRLAIDDPDLAQRSFEALALGRKLRGAKALVKPADAASHEDKAAPAPSLAAPRRRKSTLLPGQDDDLRRPRSGPLKAQEARLLDSGNAYARRPVIEVPIVCKAGLVVPAPMIQALADIIPPLSEKVPDFGGWKRVMNSAGPVPITAVIEVLAIMAQRYAGWPVRFCAWRPETQQDGSMPDAEAAAEPRGGRAPTETTNNARAVFEIATRTTGFGALKIALAVASALLDGKETEELQTIFLEEISALKQATSHERPNGDALEIAREAMRRGISWSAVEGSNLLRLGSGRFAHVLAGSETTLTTRMAHRLTQSKAVTNDILNAAGLPIPRQRFVRSEEEALDAVRVVGLPLMVKPATGSKGRAVSAGIIDEADVLPALHRALAVSPEAIIEAFVPGEEYRLLIVGGRFAAAARRRPAQVRGDGASSVRTLVEKENARPERNQRLSGRTKSLVPLALDEEALALLAEQGLSPAAVPSEGHAVLLRRQASHASGGDTVDVTDIVHHTIQKMAGRAAALFGIDVCGVDFVTTDITRPCEEFGGAICDITTRPSLRLHYDVAQGKARNVAGNILDMLFPRDAPSRCPVVVLVGTNEETTEIRRAVERAAARAGRTLGIIIGPEGAENLAPTTRRLKNLRAVDWDKEVEAILVQASAAEVAERGLGLERINLAVLPEKDGDPTLGAARSALARLSGNRVLQPDDPAARRRVLAALGLSKSARTGEKKVRPEPARSLDKAKAHPAPLSVAAANVTATLPPTGDRLKAKGANPVVLMAGDIGFGDLETRLGKPDFSRLRALEMRLGKPDFARWRARTGGWFRPAPLDKADAAAYAVHRLQASQYNYSAGLQFFDEAGLAALYALSKGVPRMIDHVMECCLLEAQASGRTSFDGEFVQACTTREGQVSHLCTGLGAFSAMPDATPVPVSPPIRATKKPVYAALGHNKPDVPVIGHARTLRMSVAAMLAGILILFPGHHARLGRMNTVIAGNLPIVPEQAGSFLSRRVTLEQAPVAESLLAEGLANESAEPEYAARLYVRAALWGNDRAAYYLGQLYETGFGVERDLQRARAWYEAADGIAGAADRLAEMAALPSQVEPASAPIPVLQRLIEPDKTELHWQGPAGAGQFRVEFIPAGGEGQARRLDTALSAVLILQPVQAWRVMALDGNGVTGPASAWSRLDPGPR